MALKLRDMEYLVALADHRNFHRAAELCHVSQPTLSAQIRRLEADLGLPLFERRPRGVELTEAGRLILPRARRMLDEAAQIEAEARSLSRAGARRLRLGVFPTLGPYLMPQVVPRFRRELPGTDLLLTEEKSGLLVQRLLEGRLDAALLAMPIDEPQLEGRELFSEPLRLALPEDHPLARRAAIDPADLAGQRMMLLDEGHCLRDQGLALCRLSGARELDDFRATSLETLRQMVSAGVGMTLLPQIASRDSAGLVALPVQSLEFRRRIGLYWRKSGGSDKLMGRLAALLREAANAQL